MKQLYVHYRSILVGTLASDPEGVFTFQYDSNWCENERAFPLSLALGIQKTPYKGKIVDSFFENLIPEGSQRKQIESVANLPENDDLAFLERFGEDCAGALSISINIKHSEEAKNDSDTFDPIPYETVEKAIRNGTPVQSVLDLHGDLPQFSLAGAQAKFPCILQDGKIRLARTGEPTSHIVKLPIRAGDKLLDSVENEYLSMRLADKCQLRVPKVEIIGSEIKLFSIERFDRESHQNKIHRIHTQDICQALGRTSKEKYEKHGGPTFAECFRVIQDNALKAAEDSLSLLDWFAFNLVIGNNDSHAKNITLLYRDQRGVELSPFYDLISTALYPQYNADFAFKVGDVSSWNKINQDRLNIFAKNLGLKGSFISARWLVMFDRVESQIKILQNEVEGDAALSKTLRKISKEIVKRIETLRTNLQKVR